MQRSLPKHRGDIERSGLTPDVPAAGAATPPTELGSSPHRAPRYADPPPKTDARDATGGKARAVADQRIERTAPKQKSPFSRKPSFTLSGTKTVSTVVA